MRMPQRIALTFLPVFCHMLFVHFKTPGTFLENNFTEKKKPEFVHFSPPIRLPLSFWFLYDKSTSE